MDERTHVMDAWAATFRAVGIDPAQDLASATTIRVRPAGSRSPVHAEAPVGQDAPPDLSLDFQLQDRLGEGGMGVVFRARQRSLGRDVAIKKLQAPEIDRADSERAFAAEARITARLEHPNVVPIHALGRDERGCLVLAMKRIEGESWEELLARDPPESGPAAQRRHLEIFGKVTDAVAFAHHRGVIHRDIKPANVMVGPFGEVYLVDWGLAVPLERRPDGQSVAFVEAPCGTPAYMAPEMAEGSREVSAAADVYLLGAVLFRIVTGAPPHRAERAVDALVAAIRNEVLPIVPTWNAPRELVEIAAKCLSTGPGDRFVSAGEMRDALERFLSGEERRRKSEELADAASELLGPLPPLEGLEPRAASALYGPLLEADALVQASLQSWAENPMARSLRVRTETALVRCALTAGDLGLAESFLRRVRAWPNDDVETLQAEIERRRRQADPKHVVALDRARQVTVQTSLAGIVTAAMISVLIGVLMKIPSLPVSAWDDDGHPGWNVALGVCLPAFFFQLLLLASVRRLEPGRVRAYRTSVALAVAMLLLSTAGLGYGLYASWEWSDRWWALVFLAPLALYRGVLGALLEPKVRALFPEVPQDRPTA